MQLALADAGLSPEQIGHINAHGAGSVEGDRVEAAAIRQAFESVPVTAFKSYFGNLGAAAGAMEMAASVLALEHGLVPPTLNYHHGDPACPLHIVQGEPLRGAAPAAMLINQTTRGQAAAVVLAADHTA
jgi:3-oxoacyl-[acyl-carrier-protein] synthase II